MTLEPGEKTTPNRHAEAASELLSDAYVVESGPMSRAEYKLRQAQVEAILALVHEQRTANLIAWQGMTEDADLYDTIAERLKD